MPCCHFLSLDKNKSEEEVVYKESIGLLFVYLLVASRRALFMP